MSNRTSENVPDKPVEKKKGKPNFTKGHPYFPPNPEKKALEKEEARLINPRVLKAIQSKALQGDEKAMNALLSYELKKKELELNSQKEFNPDEFLKSFDAALRERDDAIANTELTCIKNKNAQSL